jgi:eukaryotic-like serine/threonine-protein kinase
VRRTIIGLRPLRVTSALTPRQETQRADSNFTAAKRTVDGLIFNIAQGLNGVVGMKVDTIRRVLGTVVKTINQLVQTPA